MRPYYRLMPGVAAYMEYDHEQFFGPVRTIRRHNNDANSQNIVALGLTWLF